MGGVRGGGPVRKAAEDLGHLGVAVAEVDAEDGQGLVVQHLGLVEDGLLAVHIGDRLHVLSHGRVIGS